MERFKGWFKDLSMTGKITSIAVASIVSLGAVGAMARPSTPSVSPASTTQAQKTQVKVETRTTAITETIAFTSSTVDDPSLAQGATQVRTAGVSGVRTITYEITLTDGAETARKEVSNSITTQPINEVLAKGTKVAQAQPSCPNGTYVNTYGNTVCRPYESSGVPAGATAQCEDGTYSFSQSRRGTCSGHDGVAVWL